MRKPTAAAAEARTPKQLAALAGHRNPPRVRERAILPARPLLKPSKITVKAVCDRRTTGHSQEDQAQVHAKTTLTVVFHRFDSAPVGRMARTGLVPLVSSLVTARRASDAKCRRYNVRPQVAVFFVDSAGRLSGASVCLLFGRG